MKKVYVMACGAALAVMATACGGNKAQQNDTDTVAVDTTVVDEVGVADSDTVPVVAVEEEVASTPAKKASKNEGKKSEAKKEEVKVPGADQATVEAAQNAIKTAKEKAGKVAEEGAASAKQSLKNKLKKTQNTESAE